ncbi:MAG: tyrosine-type recombinase/integrase [Promethearchaeota archaeon]
MNVNWAENRENEISTPTDLFRQLATSSYDKSLVLEQLIPKSVGEALEEFLLDLKIEERSPKTLRFYRERLKWFVDFIEPSTLLGSIKPATIRQFFSVQDSKPIYGYHAKYRALRAFLNWCVKQNYLLDSPITFSPPKLPDIIKPAFKDEELKRILNSCVGSLGLRNKAMVMVLIDTGVRLEELTRIKIDDIDVDARLISIHGKGRKERLVHISPTTLKTIWQYLKVRGNPSEYLWLTEEGRHITGRGISEALETVRERAGIPKHKTVHTFRHTFANNRLDEGMNPLDLQYLLGHADLTMVERYSRAHKQRRALKALERQQPVDRLIKGESSG